MFLSQLTLQLSSPSVRQSLRNCQDMHRTMMKAFDCTRQEASLLYRVYKTERSIFIYAQSAALPHWERIEANGYHCVKMKDISALPDALQKDAVLRFSLLACPARKIKGEGKNSKRVLLRGEDERLNWLEKQGEKYGFRLIEAHEASKEQLFSGEKPSGEFHLAGVPFEGVLQITDADAFRRAFQQGVGAEKAYGFGMLMIGRAAP